eukprot:TRINITY_DN13911_c0_g1_i1.p1 TRINITY_DN13911_c0_g1~~TRINITY_DN13911_c0_g1_i1.p1  ORF type:complete len:714 (-),score=128.18 TRINITY_DN13911_c0_g1_i1:320-2461(-)
MLRSPGQIAGLAPGEALLTLHPGQSSCHGHSRNSFGQSSGGSKDDDGSAPSIFSEVVKVHVKPAGRDEFTAALTMRLRPDNAAHPRSLLFELTDESDLLFYHSLILGEGDFHSLKAEQRLRVDFQGFPSQLVELLRRCMSAADVANGAAANGCGLAESLRMLAQLECAKNGDSVFSIIESNMFRELTHIALRLRQGTDEAVKQHLAGKLRNCRSEAADLSERLHVSEEQVDRLRQQVEELSARARVVSEERTHLERSLDATHQRELAELRQDHLRVLTEQQRTAIEDRSRVETELRRELSVVSARATTAERLSEDLQQKLETLTASKKSCQERLEVAEAQFHDATQETQRCRNQVKELELLKFQHEREIGEFGMQVSGLRGQLKAKEELSATQMTQIEQFASQRRTLEDACAAAKQQVQSLEEKFALSAQEIAKGNQIIQSLHAAVKQTKARLKAKSSESVRQDKAVLDLKRTEELGKHLLDEKELELTRGKDREARLQHEVDEANRKLAEAHEVVRTNKDVIEYLNRQLTERDLKELPMQSATSAVARRVGGAGGGCGTVPELRDVGGMGAPSPAGGVAISGQVAELLRRADALTGFGSGGGGVGNARLGTSGAAVGMHGTVPTVRSDLIGSALNASPPSISDSTGDGVSRGLVGGGASYRTRINKEPSPALALGYTTPPGTKLGHSPPGIDDLALMRGPVSFRSPQTDRGS